MRKKEIQRQKGFILTGHWNEEKASLEFWGRGERGPFFLTFDSYRPFFYVEGSSNLSGLRAGFERVPTPLSTFSGKSVHALTFAGQKDLHEAAGKLSLAGILTYEADIRPPERFLMEKFIHGSIEISGPVEEAPAPASSCENWEYYLNPEIHPTEYFPPFRVLSLDIETGARGELYSVALHAWTMGETPSTNLKIVLTWEKKKQGPVEGDFQWETYPTEKEILIRFLDHVREIDPDLIIGWNVVAFDLAFLKKKCEEFRVPFALGRAGGLAAIHERGAWGHQAYLKGRIVLDGPAVMRTHFFQFKNFRLETVARELLGRGKEIAPTSDKVAEIERLFQEDKRALASYNLQDTLLVSDIFKQTRLLELLLTRSWVSGLPLDRVGASIPAFDHFFLPRLHLQGLVAGNQKDRPEEESLEGGYVMDPVAGLHHHVIVLDFKGLYPSVIRTFKIDPLSLARSETDPLNTPVGIPFSRTEHILPQFMEQLMKRRKEAKAQGNSILDKSFKILMNSFYGVMSAPGSRFYHPRIAAAITGTGQWVLKETRRFLQGEGYEVLYGDTDSLFVKLKPPQWEQVEAEGRNLAQMINRFFQEKIEREFQLESHLEAVFEKNFQKLFLPHPRGKTGTGGAKKKYAGLLIQEGSPSLHFVGMEFIRSDWTDLAKKFQWELFHRLFFQEDFIQGLQEWIRGFLEELKKGVWDELLVYQKRLTKDPRDYTKTKPPHVKAALLLPSGQERKREIHYVMTRRGPIPLELPHSDIDYEHYVEKQVKPIAEDVLPLFHLTFDDLLEGGQGSLF